MIHGRCLRIPMESHFVASAGSAMSRGRAYNLAATGETTHLQSEKLTRRDESLSILPQHLSESLSIQYQQQANIMIQAITVVVTFASLVGSASGFLAPSAPRAFVTSLCMAEKVVVLPDIVDTAIAAGSFSTLAAALGAADLVDTLKGEGPFTVFAPTDEAFAKLPEGTVADLLKPENKAKLAGILTYHVLAGEVMASTVVTMDGKSAATVNGASVTIGVKDGVVTVDDATVVTTDIKTSNGVIHIIDSVMIPK
jgi:uncharacterized surface protein with fasciclin (FAS1) repeats